MYYCDQLTESRLLSLRDGEPVDALLALHAAECPRCQGALRQLRARRDALRALPELQAPSWSSAVSVGDMSSGTRPAHSKRLALVAGVGAVLVASVAIVVTLQSRPPLPSAMENVAAIQTVNVTSTLPELVEQSQRLEAVLALLPESRSIERAGTATTIEALQARIQWLDFQLSVAGDVGLTERQALELWQDRVQLLDSLIKVSNADTQRIAML